MLKIQPAIYSIFFLLVFSLNELSAEIRKPNPEIKPREVVEIQLNALMKNDDPEKDSVSFKPGFLLTQTIKELQDLLRDLKT